MTSPRPIPLLVLACLAVAGCYRHPPPVDGGPRDAQVPDTSDAGEPLDASDASDATDADGTDDAGALECEEDADCDADPCTTARCDAGVCVADPIDDATTCDDGDVCTRADVCAAGTCVGTRVSCAVCDATDGAFLTTFRAAWHKGPRAYVAMPDGGHAVTGFGDGDAWLGAIDRAGAITIDRGYGHASMGDRGFAIARPSTTPGEVLVGGYSQVGGGPALAWMVRVDARDGDERGARALWDDRNGSVHGILLQPDGSTILLATSGARATIVRIAADGTLGPERSYFDVGWAYGLAGIVEMPGGDLVFAGDAGAFPDRKVRVVRVRATGEVVWDRVLDAQGALDLVAQGDGSVIVGGQSWSGDGTGGAWLTRIDAAGGTRWERFYGEDPNASIASIAMTAEGLLLAASTNDDAWLIRTDRDGVLLDETTLALGGYESATIVRADGAGFVVSGTSRVGEGADAPIHAWILRADSFDDLACPAD
ncbi:MAG: hypothetical protein M3Y87_12720 [Myxococcota bacterium]|nr:hypothetical protein [Myxococcota bacterium]